MSAIICPHCRVANSAFETLCHCCSGRLPEVPGVKRPAEVARETPVQLILQKRKEARWAARILFGAAGMSALRGVIYPILIAQSPHGTFGNINVDELRIISYSLAVAFVALSLLARKTPLLASAIAMMIYLATAVPEVITGQGLIGRGLISKGVMVMILGRALLSGIYHNMISR
jgi:hypothetical protein